MLNGARSWRLKEGFIIILHEFDRNTRSPKLKHGFELCCRCNSLSAGLIDGFHGVEAFLYLSLDHCQPGSEVEGTHSSPLDGVT